MEYIISPERVLARNVSSLLFLACGVGVSKERNGGNSIFLFISNYHTSLSSLSLSLSLSLSSKEIII
jgi:hypothetical protein